MQELIDSQSPRERRQSTVKLEGIVEEQEKARERDDEYEKAQKEVVKLFEERIGGHSNNDCEHLNVGEMLRRLEDDLVEKGMERKEADQALFPITKALLRQPLPPAVERRSSTQKPEFKLDLFDVKEETDYDRGNRSDVASLSIQDKALVSPDDVDEFEDEELIAAQIGHGSAHGLDIKPTASPVSFLARRRPLLETRMRSSDLILPRT
ncbi:hypothetical protein DL98DRAFT_514493 [Cadophora sp. DSE1049]|nr:hypothetical protein DL98DRAFT_514493 [Cadophora sp. DSE1049]